MRRGAFLASVSVPRRVDSWTRAYSTRVESSQTRLAGRNSVVTKLHVGNVSRASSTVTVGSQRGRVKGIEGGCSGGRIGRRAGWSRATLKSLGCARDNVAEKAGMLGLRGGGWRQPGAGCTG